MRRLSGERGDLSARGEVLFDIRAYDCDPYPTDDELEALWYVYLHQAGGGLKEAYLSLGRLDRPLCDAVYSLDLGDTKPRSVRLGFRGARRRIFLDILRRRRTFWGWSEDKWAATIRSAREDYRSYVVLAAYLLGGISGLELLEQLQLPGVSARKVFGRGPVDEALSRVKGVLEGWGYSGRSPTLGKLEATLCRAMLVGRSPRPEDIDQWVIEALSPTSESKNTREGLVLLSQVLTTFGTLPGPLPETSRGPVPRADLHKEVAPEWREWCDRWLKTSTLARRDRIHRDLLRVGSWLAQNHPEVRSPEQWDPPLAAEYVATIDELKGGDLGCRTYLTEEKLGKPYAANTKNQLIYVMRRFLQDCQEWGWISVRLDAGRCLRTPRSIANLIGPDPKVIDDAVWAKLVAAGLDLKAEDIPQRGKSGPFYPAEIIRAVAAVWLFTGLRTDEIRRLKVGCVRWQRLEASSATGAEETSEESVCFLDVPVNKTSTAFTKPVHPIVGKRIEEWERARPADQPSALNEKTGEMVHYLFSCRGRRLGGGFINESLIPMLCRKAGLPESDSRGRISAHRARSTITSQLYNGPDPWSLPELGAWLGHKSLRSTQHYARIDPTRLAEKYANSGYLERNVATVEALLDVEALANGHSEDALYYDLGHGLCANPYWAQCPYRLACVKCPMYVPGEQAQYVRAKKGIRRMLETIPLTEEEKRAAEGDEEAINELLAKNDKVPMPGSRQGQNQQIVSLGKKPAIENREDGEGR